MSFTQVHSSHGSLSNYPPIPNPLLGPDAAHLAQNYYMGSSHGEVPPHVLGQEQNSREEQLGTSFDRDMPSNRGYGWPDRTQYGHGGIEDEVAMDESDDESPDPQSLTVRDYRDVLKPYTRGGTEVRTFSAFAQNYALSEYMDYVHSSELRRHDMQTIFRHFVSVTGPTMSLYERDPTSLASGARFDGDATLDNNLWSRKCLNPPFSNHLCRSRRCRRHRAPLILSQIRFLCCPSITLVSSTPLWQLQVYRLQISKILRPQPR